MKKLLLIILLAIATAGFAQAGDVPSGKAKSTSCKACHGADGISSIPSYPNLAGQKEAYLVVSLKAYKTSERKNATMASMVKPLSDADIDNLSAYYASLSACP